MIAQKIFWLVLSTGVDPCSIAIVTNGGSSLEECQALGAAKIAAMAPVKIGTMPLEGGEMTWREEPASSHWRLRCGEWH